MKLWLTYHKGGWWIVFSSKPKADCCDGVTFWRNDHECGHYVKRPKCIRGHVRKPTCWVGEVKEWKVTK
jgi:hypothetical protein